MSKKEEVKDKPSLEGGRSLFTVAEAEKFIEMGFIFLVKPLKMIARSKWTKLSGIRYSKEKEFWEKEGLGDTNPYLKNATLVDVKYGGELDPEKMNVIWGKAVDEMAKDKEKLEEYFKMNDVITRGRKYSFGEFSNENWYSIFDIVAEHCSVVENGKELQLTRDAIENNLSYEQLVYLCGKIDEVSTLSISEVLGLG